MLETLLRDGWDYPDTQSERLACELEAAAIAGVAPTLLVSFLNLSTHTIGEHLGDWPRALALGRRVLDGHKPTADTGKAWARLQVAAILCNDFVTAAAAEIACLTAVGDALAALLDMRFMLINALVGERRRADALRLYGGALDLAERIEGTPDLHRIVAVASNNLAWELFEMPHRTAQEDALMRRAAGASFTFWRRCGTWINEERGLYLKAMVALATGHAETALALAEAGLGVIAAHGERPLDTARLHLARAQSLAALGDEQGRAEAFAAADAAAEGLASEALRQEFIAARARAAGLQTLGE
ncbi:hypothetical protein [Labrys neptuniae]